MRRKRLLGGKAEGAVYHVISRVVDRERLFDAGWREELRRGLRVAADFSGVRVLTFALLSNHFHLLVRIPPAAPVADAELVRRFRVLYPRPTSHQPMPARVLAAKLARGGPEAEALRRRLTRRMGDLSEFAKTFKQRMAIRVNQTRGRCGPLWSDRFRSVLVEGWPAALRTVAAYIDLNPVRAGLVADPKDYRWCGYHEAVVGRREARRGLAAVMGRLDGPPPGRAEERALLREYRMLLFGTGAADREGKAALAPEQVRAVLEAGGRLPLAEAARVRLGHLGTGLALGRREWVGGQAERVRSPRPGPRRGQPRPLEFLRDVPDLAILTGVRAPRFGGRAGTPAAV